ncbi:MAG: AAA family ATPase [Thermomicrobiales bacterium]
MTFDPQDHPEFLDQIDRATMGRNGRAHGREVRFTCPNPGHQDDHPSADWNREKAAWTCRTQACHESMGGGAMALAKALGVDVPDDRPPWREGPRITVGSKATVYTYYDADWVERWQVRRRDTATGKDIRPWHLNAKGVWAMGKGPDPWPPYQLPYLLAVDLADETVFVVEGEKVAERLLDEDVVATTNDGGAKKWKAEHAAYLQGRNVVILPDNDEPGKQHAEMVARGLVGIAASTKVLTLPGLPLKGDAVDWLEDGGTAEGLRRLVEAAPEWEMLSDQPIGEVWSERKSMWVTARETAEATPERPEWIALGYVAAGAVTEIDGKIKGGKTTLVMALIAAVRKGRPFLGQPTMKTSVVYLTEQNEGSYREALRRAGLLTADDVHILYWSRAQGMGWEEVVGMARIKAHEVGAKLVVVDTLAHWAGLKGDAENNAGAALEAVGPLLAAAADGLGVVVLRHERKSGGDVGDSARGSSAFGGAVDIVVQVSRSEGNARPTLRKLTSLSRFDETPDEQMVELTEAGEYVSRGDGAAVAHAEALAAVMMAVPDREGFAAEEKDILEATGIARATARRALEELIRDGKVVRVGDGKRGSPYRFWRSGSPQKGL